MLNKDNRPTSAMVARTGWLGTVHLESRDVHLMYSWCASSFCYSLLRVDGNKLN